MIKHENNKHSLFAKYRKELAKSNEMIKNELEKTKIINFNVYKNSRVVVKNNLPKQEKISYSKIASTAASPTKLTEYSGDINKTIFNNSIYSRNNLKKSLQINDSNLIFKTEANLKTHLKAPSLIVENKIFENFKTYDNDKSTSAKVDVRTSNKIASKIDVKRVKSKYSCSLSKIITHRNKLKIDDSQNSNFDQGNVKNENSNYEKIVDNFKETSTYKRIKKYKVEFDPHWYDKQGLPSLKMSQKEVLNIDYQSITIIDGIKVILENIQYFKMFYLNKSDIKIVFSTLDTQKQLKMNTIIEETCALMLDVSNSILADFSKFLEKIVSVLPLHPEKLTEKVVKNEEKAFYVNVNILNNSANFLKCCYETYCTLIKQVDDMIIPYKNFIKIHQFLSRIRLNISNLIFSSKNYIKNYNFDNRVLQKANIFIKKNQKDDNNKEYIQKNDLADKIRKEYNFKINEESERKRRLNIILVKKSDKLETSFEKKKKEIGKSLLKNGGLNDPIVSKMMKYFPKEIKHEIVSERLLSRNKERNNEILHIGK